MHVYLKPCEPSETHFRECCLASPEETCRIYTVFSFIPLFQLSYQSLLTISGSLPTLSLYSKARGFYFFALFFLFLIRQLVIERFLHLSKDKIKPHVFDNETDLIYVNPPKVCCYVSRLEVRKRTWLCSDFSQNFQQLMIFIYLCIGTLISNFRISPNYYVHRLDRFCDKILSMTFFTSVILVIR